METKKIKIIEIKSAMRNLGLRNIDVAKKLGVNPQTISSWLNNRNFPRTKYLFKLRKLLKKSLKNDIVEK